MQKTPTQRAGILARKGRHMLGEAPNEIHAATAPAFPVGTACASKASTVIMTQRAALAAPGCQAASRKPPMALLRNVAALSMCSVKAVIVAKLLGAPRSAAVPDFTGTQVTESGRRAGTTCPPGGVVQRSPRWHHRIRLPALLLWPSTRRSATQRMNRARAGLCATYMVTQSHQQSAIRSILLLNCPIRALAA